MTFAIQQFNKETKTWAEPRGDWHILLDAKAVVDSLKTVDVRDYSSYVPITADMNEWKPVMFEKGIWRVCVTNNNSWQYHGQGYLSKDGRIEITPIDYLVAEFKQYDCNWHKKADFYLPHSVGDNKVGFFSTREDVMLNNPTVLTVGKFIKRHFEFTHQYPVAYGSDFAAAPTEKQLSDFHNLLLDACAQKFADSVGAVDWSLVTNSGEIAKAYMEGPNSCMAHAAGSYDTDGIHPTEVYGGKSDISLLVVRRDGRITGRTLVWKEKKLHSTVYGDNARIRLALAELFGGPENFRKHSFEGALLKKIPVGDGDSYVMAYVDGSAGSVDHAGDMFKIVKHGEFVCDQFETGVIGEQNTCCSRCGDHGRYEDLIEFDYDIYCSECLADVAFYNENTYRYSPIENVIEVYVGCSRYPEQWDCDEQSGEYFYCHFENQYYCSNSNVPVDMANGETWLEEAFEENGFTSKFDGDNYHIDEAIHCPAFDGLITIAQYDAMGFMALKLAA